jgi:hypothetical protein
MSSTDLSEMDNIPGIDISRKDQGLVEKEENETKNSVEIRNRMKVLKAFQDAAKFSLDKMAYSQKATFLKLLDQIHKKSGSQITGNEELVNEENLKAAEEAEELLEEISDSMINTLANLAVLSALVGITTYTAVISPSSPSDIDPPSSSSITIPRLITILNMGCTAFAMLTICLATSYIYIMENLLVEPSDRIWLIVHIPVVNQSLLFCVLSVFLAILSLLISCYYLYSKGTADACVITGTCLLVSFFFIILPIIRKVLNRVDIKGQLTGKKLKRKEEANKKSRK